MAVVNITVNPGAFSEDPNAEAARILREVADRIEHGERRFTVDDKNGSRSAKVRAQDIPVTGQA